MDEEDLLVVIERSLKNYQDNLNKIKKDLHQRGAYGGSVSYYIISNRRKISWMLDSLEKMGCDTTQFEKEFSKIDEEFKAYEDSHKEEFLDQLYNDLKNLIGEYGKYFSDFQEEKDYFRTSDKVAQVDKAYFLNRDDGLFFADGYEFDIIIEIRTYIEILFEYLDGKFDIEGLGTKVLEMDTIFKRDMDDILISLEMNGLSFEVPYAPEEYWWLHIK